jgi:hypothetical protein
MTFQTDNRLIRRMIGHWLRKAIGGTRDSTPVPQVDDNANPLFPPAFFKMLATRRPMLLVFGGSDRLHWEYDEKFVSRHRERLAAMPPLAEVHVVELANHVLSLPEWQDEMLEVATRWMKRHFLTDPARQPHATAVPAQAVSDR